MGGRTARYDMSRPVESRSATARTSSAVAKLGRQYIYYVMDCVKEDWDIIPITKFYSLMRKQGELPRSRVFEKYLSTPNKEPEE